jgi:hypothetical protein
MTMPAAMPQQISSRRHRRSPRKSQPMSAAKTTLVSRVRSVAALHPGASGTGLAWRMR